MAAPRKTDRLLDQREIRAALADRALEPLRTVPLTVVVDRLRELVAVEGNIARTSRKLNMYPSEISEMLNGKRFGIGTKIAKALGLRPKKRVVLEYEVLNPRKFYRPSL